MSRRSSFLFLAFVLFLAFAPLWLGRMAASQGVEEIEACMRANMPESTSVQTVKLKSVDRSGGERTLDARIFWKRSEEGYSRTRIQVEGPPSDRGTAYLLREHEDRSDTWVFLPELEKVRRIHPRSAGGSLFGTDFTYEDVQHLQNISGGSGSTERLPDGDIDGRPVSVVRAVPSPEQESSYESIRYSIDKETCLPLRIEFFQSGESLQKVLETDPATITREGESWIARSLSIRDVANETQTHLEVEKVEFDSKIPDRIFSQGNLARKAR